MIPVFDGHNDLAWACRETRGYDVGGLDAVVASLHTDVPRLRAGGVGAQFWSAWVDPSLRGAEQVTATLEQFDAIARLVESYPETFAAARRGRGPRSSRCGSSPSRRRARTR